MTTRIAGRLLRLAPVLWLTGATGADRLEISMGTIAGDGWQAEHVRVALNLETGGSELRIGRLLLPGPVGEVLDVAAACAGTVIDGASLACRNGRFRLRHPQIGADAFRGNVSFDRRSGRLAFELANVPLAGGKATARGGWHGGVWQLDGHALALDLGRLQALAAEFIELPEGDAAGRADVRYRLRGRGTDIAGRLRVDLSGTDVASAGGRFATEALAARLTADLRKQGQQLTFAMQLGSDGGQLYAEPVFVDTAAFPVTVEAYGVWSSARGELQLSELRLRQPQALSLDAALSWRRDDGLTDMQLLLRDAALPGAYQMYLQPFLIGTPADSLATGGRINGTVSLSAGRPEMLRLALEDVDLTDESGRFRLHGLAGSLRWQAGADVAALPTELRWRRGAVGGIAFGSASAQLRTQADGVELLAPVGLPVLDGSLDVSTLRIARIGAADMAMAFDATLSPVDLRSLSRALGWPELSGTIAGRLPSLRYEAGRLAVGGRLEVEAFGGRVRVEGLQLDQPLSQLPRLSADVAIDDIDLEALTETFAFGRIEGRLSGRIDRLRLVNWQPASFDARFYTSPADRSPRRISQRAIENLSSIGGAGATAVLSRGFLRFFEDFAYDRIGLSCRLRQDVCVMGGLGAAGNGGYYIVRGRGLPRVDVIGFQREVSWPTLVEQLKSVTAADGPIIR